MMLQVYDVKHIVCPSLYINRKYDGEDVLWGKIAYYQLRVEAMQMEALKCNNTFIEESDERKPVSSYFLLKSLCVLTFLARLAGSSSTALGDALTKCSACSAQPSGKAS